MAGWWNTRGLRGLLERHEPALRGVWPALRDGRDLPPPPPADAGPLAALSAAAVQAAAGGGEDAPELSAALLASAVLHRAERVTVPPALRPFVDPSAEVDAATARTAGSLAAGLAARARAAATPDWLRPCCLDAALVCATRALSGPPPDPSAHGTVHDLLAHLAKQRFARDADPADEEAAIRHARAAHQAAAPDTAPVRAGHLSRLLSDRAARLRDSSLAGDAPALARSALAALDPASRAWLGQAANTLGILLQATAQEREDVTLLDEALDLMRRMRGHPHHHLVDDALRRSCAGVLAQRFARSRDPETLDRTIEAYATLYRAEPAQYAADLGRHHQYRHQLRGDPADRRLALRLMAEGLSGDRPRAEAVTSYAAAAMHEYREHGDPAVLTQALATVTRLTAPGAPHTDDSRVLSTLADLLLAHSEVDRGGGLDRAEATARRALETAHAPADRAGALARLAEILANRYRHTLDLALLDEAVAAGREGFAVLPPDAEVPAQLPAGLVMALIERYTRVRHLASLREAVVAARQLADATPEFGAEYPVILGTLVSLLVAHARETDTPAELDTAQELAERALAGTPPGHRWRARLQNALGGVLLARARRPGAPPEAADTAVRHFEAALREDPRDDPQHSAASLHTHHAHALWERHRHHGDRADLDRAVEAARTALRRLPPGEPGRGGALIALSRVLGEIARVDGGHDAVRDEELAVNAELAADPAQSALVRTSAALETATVARESGDTERSLAAARSAVETLPLLAWRGVDRADQEEMLGRVAAAGSLAGLVALAAGRPAEALELLEAGRGVLAFQALELRTETEELAAAEPELAARLDTLRKALDQAAGDGVSGEEADRRHRLAREWQETLEAIRARDGFRDFLRPPRAGQLLAAGAEGPVVVITGGPDPGGHALLLTGTHPADLKVCPLPAYSDTEAGERAETLLAAAAAAARSGLARAFAEQAVADVLDWLWRTVAAPVLDALGITGPPPPGESPPRLWWCPAGALSFLPLHAAGEVPDRVVSSYTPSVTALLRARARRLPAADTRPLIVAVPELDGLAPLPGALREAGVAHAAMGGTLLSGEEARPEAVRAALTAHSWAHFACHGVQDPEHPSEGRLLLPGGELSVLDVSRLDLPGAEFAYLSACETAVGGTSLPDEALHLAASLQLAGFSQVVGTLWRVDDESSAEIAREVYETLAAARAHGPSPARASGTACPPARSPGSAPPEAPALASAAVPPTDRAGGTGPGDPDRGGADSAGASGTGPDGTGLDGADPAGAGPDSTSPDGESPNPTAPTPRPASGVPPAALALHRATRRLRERCPDRPLSWAAHVHSGA
ncbi:CHAT domain-containing protein [Streptomyces pharetrae]|uniref:CHAT domain-containing protein n=1 Tax=Streptomyces pharetrae TaxID=291370 RepID=UPI00365CB20D